MSCLKWALADYLSQSKRESTLPGTESGDQGCVRWQGKSMSSGHRYQRQKQSLSPGHEQAQEAWETSKKGAKGAVIFKFRYWNTKTDWREPEHIVAYVTHERKASSSFSQSTCCPISTQRDLFLCSKNFYYSCHSFEGRLILFCRMIRFAQDTHCLFLLSSCY